MADQYMAQIRLGIWLKKYYNIILRKILITFYKEFWNA